MWVPRSSGLETVIHMMKTFHRNDILSVISNEMTREDLETNSPFCKHLPVALWEEA